VDASWPHGTRRGGRPTAALRECGTTHLVDVDPRPADLEP